MHAEIDALIDAATRPYFRAGLYAYFFARGKLRHDPIFFSLLRTGRIPDRARVLDLGCGYGVLASLVLAARTQFELGRWPSGWAAPPSQVQLQGVEMQRGAAKRAQIALGNRATIHTADLRDAPLPEADVVLMIDVLHYLDMDAQISLLGKVAQCLRGGGMLVMRVADISAGWRFHAGIAADRLGSLMTFGMPSHYHRPLEEWLHLLDDVGFEPELESSGPEKSFANVLVWAKARPLMKA